MLYNGMELVESKAMIQGYKQIPKKINKSKRIQKKWNKKYGFHFINIPDPQVFIFDNKIIGHPIIIRKLIKAMIKHNQIIQ
ncbi:hypothetical protein [Clostridium sp.]